VQKLCLHFKQYWCWQTVKWYLKITVQEYAAFEWASTDIKSYALTRFPFSFLYEAQCLLAQHLNTLENVFFNKVLEKVKHSPKYVSYYV